MAQQLVVARAKVHPSKTIPHSESIFPLFRSCQLFSFLPLHSFPSLSFSVSLCFYLQRCPTESTFARRDFSSPRELMNVAVKQKVHREFIAVPRLSLPPPEHRAPASGCESSPPTRISWFRSITRERRYARSVKVLALNKASAHSAMRIEEEDRRSRDRKRIPWHASASLALSQPLSLDLASAFQRRGKRIFERRKKEASEGLARVSRRSL